MGSEKATTRRERGEGEENTCMKMMKKGEASIMASMEAVLMGLDEPPWSF